MSRLILQTNEMCPFAQRVNIALNITFGSSNQDIIEINLGNKPDWFLKLNPKGLIPVIRHNNNIVCESEDILDYISNLDGSKLKLNDQNLNEIIEQRKLMIELIKEGKSSQPQGSNLLINIISKFNEKVVNRKFYLGGEYPSIIDASFFPFGQRIINDFKSKNSDNFVNLKKQISQLSNLDEFKKTIVKSYWMWW